MDITIDNAELLPALNLVNNVIERQQTLPILANLLFEVRDKHLTLVGTNFEIELTRRLPQAVDSPDGAFTVAARKIVEICRNLPKDDKIRLKSADDLVTVTCGRSRFSLKTLPAAEFTRVDAQGADATPLDWEERFSVPAAAMTNLLRRTSFAMGKNDPRFYLNGALIELASTGIKMVATNSHRLAQSEFKRDIELGEPRQLIVPRKAITELQHLLDLNMEDDAEMQVSVSPSHLKIVCGDSTLISKLIDASYPEFQSVLDKFDEATRIPLPRQEMVEALTRVKVMTAERFNGVRLAFAPEEMTISARNQENEEADEKLTVEYSGEPVESGYNVEYLLDIFRTAAPDEQLDFYLQSEQGICFIRPPETPETLWLVMPMRI